MHFSDACLFQPVALFPQSAKDIQKNVATMTDFALSIMAALDNINQHSFNNFKLRIGKHLLKPWR